jgi:hypothetical protein
MNGCRLAQEQKEGRLKHVLRIFGRDNDAPGHRQHQRPMPLEQGYEGGLFPKANKPVQQFGIAEQSVGFDLRAEVADDRIQA